MHREKSISVLLVLVFFVFNLICLPVFAEELSEEDKAKIQEKQIELEQIQGQMGEKKEKVDKARQKARTAYQELSVVESALAQAEGELSEIQGNLGKVENQISENEEFLYQAELRLDDRSKAYNKRVRNIYMHGQLNYLDVLLGAKDFSDFTTRFELLMRIVKNDIGLISEIKKEKAEVNSQQEKLKVSQNEMQKLRDEAAAKREVIASRRQQRSAVFQQAAAERNQEEREYNDLMATSQKITDMIRRIESGGKAIGKGTGVMQWPVRGPITSPFGWRTHPIFGTQKYHSGIDIASDYGVPVGAADEGTVISSGWLGGYGYTVIIDHGSGTTTLYAHNSELHASVGDMVYKGQTIALIGSTGYSTGPHCHFEVRRHGETVNPLNYLP